MFNMTQELVKILGIEPARLRLEWISSAEGARFAEVAREFIGELEAAGPSPLSQQVVGG